MTQKKHFMARRWQHGIEQNWRKHLYLLWVIIMIFHTGIRYVLHKRLISKPRVANQQKHSSMKTWTLFKFYKSKASKLMSEVRNIIVIHFMFLYFNKLKCKYWQNKLIKYVKRPPVIPRSINVLKSNKFSFVSMLCNLYSLLD